jgi:hypothetical protein
MDLEHIEVTLKLRPRTPHCCQEISRIGRLAVRTTLTGEWESPSGEECEPRTARRTVLITVEDDMVCGGKIIAGIRVHPGPKQCQPRSGRWGTVPLSLHLSARGRCQFQTLSKKTNKIYTPRST